MSKITSVESQKSSKVRSAFGRKNIHRFNIFLDDKFAFGADEDTVVNYRLVVGKDIDYETLNKLLFETEVGKLMERMYGLFSRRQRTEKEVKVYLKNLSFKRKVKGQDEITDVVTENLIQKLKQKGLLNDPQFAALWVEARSKSKKKGKIALKMELYQKGIDRQTIEKTLEESSIDEQKLAEQALEKKLNSWKNLEFMEFRKKAFEYLLRRGFSYELVKDLIEKQIKLVYNNYKIEESDD